MHSTPSICSMVISLMGYACGCKLLLLQLFVVTFIVDCDGLVVLITLYRCTIHHTVHGHRQVFCLHLLTFIRYTYIHFNVSIVTVFVFSPNVLSVLLQLQNMCVKMCVDCSWTCGLPYTSTSVLYSFSSLALYIYIYTPCTTLHEQPTDIGTVQKNIML